MWEAKEAERRKKDWEKRPKGKRVQFDSVKLSEEKTGEIGEGWACAWDALRLSSTKDCSEAEANEETEKKELKLYRVPTSIARSALGAKSNSAIPTPPPPHGVITVKLTLIQRGVPTTCARIYCLPTTNPALAQQWHTLLSTSKTKMPHNKRTHPLPPPPNAPAHELRRHLAESLLLDEANTTVQAGDKEYPNCPDEADLIGFVTTGNFNLGEGRGTGVGCVLLEKVMNGGEDAKENRQICIVREAGQTLGRLARWELV